MGFRQILQLLFNVNYTFILVQESFLSNSVTEIVLATEYLQKVYKFL